jgi:hypothetical protein
MIIVCEHGNKPSGSIKDEDFLDEMSDYHLLKNETTA